MKKLTLLLALMAMTVTAWAATTFESGNFTYYIVSSPASSSDYGELECAGLSTSAKSQTSLNLDIPAIVTYNGNKYCVTAVQDSAFAGNTAIKSVQLHYGIKTIGSWAFQGCTSMTYTLIPSSVTTMNEKCYYGCTSLNTVYMASLNPSKMKISYYAFNASTTRMLCIPWGVRFDNYRNLNVFTTFYFPKISHSKFSYDFFFTNGASMVVSKPSASRDEDHEVTVIGYTKLDTDGIFTLYDRITTSTCDRGLKYVAIADSACYGNTDLTQIDFSLATGMTRIGYNSFANCTNLGLADINVDTICSDAFNGCKALETVTWTSRLKYIMSRAFYESGLNCPIILPVGFIRLENYAFNGTKVHTILLPNSTKILTDHSFWGMRYLTNLYINNEGGRFFGSSSTFYFNYIPTTCNVYVPVGKLAKAKAHANWSRFTNIQEGAYDFAYGGNINSPYKMTVTSTTPVTVDGVTYDGKAKYVYSTNRGTAKIYTFDNYEVDKMLNGNKKYLMTEIGDSCLAESDYTTVNFSDMIHLSRIGKKAFYGAKLTSADLPNSRLSFGVDAFYGANNLTEIVTRSAGFSWDGRFFGDNATGFNLYIHNDYIYNVLNSSMKDYVYNDNNNTTCSERVAPCFTATATTYPLAIQRNLNFGASNLPENPSLVSTFDPATSTATTTQTRYGIEGKAVILTGLTVGTFYKIPRYYSSIQSSYTSILTPVGAATDIYDEGNAYYWDTDKLRFVKAISSHTVPSGQAYLQVDGGKNFVYLDLFPGTAVTGDINGDGIVDITDINMCINMVLGKLSKTAEADVNGNGEVDITDVNMVVNMAMGK